MNTIGSIRSFLSSFRRKAGGGDEHSIQIEISLKTDALFSELAQITNNTDRADILRQAMRVHTAFFDEIAKGNEVLFEDAGGNLTPVAVGTGATEEIHEDWEKSIGLRLSARSRTQMEQYASLSNCRDLCDLMVHALRSYRKAIDLTEAGLRPVLRRAGGKIIDFPIFHLEAA